MGVIITKQGIEENSFTWEYYCDTYEDMENIAQENVTIGSYCTLLNGENGVEIYTGDGNHQWVLITPSIRDKYSADNDGKVILNGNALSQTNLTITENGTFNTTLNNSVEVLVEPSLQNKTVTTNGVVTHDNNYYGLDQVTVNVPNSYEDEDEDKVVQNGVLVNQTSRTITENGTYNTTINNEVIIATENVYENSDEGKVVKNGELIEQTSYSIDENGTYDTTEYNEVVVDIENTINLQSKTTTVNGEILPDNGYDGLSQVTVAVEGGATLQTKTITENGTIEPDNGYDGFSEVTVNVSNSYEEEDEGKVVSGGELISQTSTTITENGTYDTTTYNEVVVDGIEVESLTINDNGTYTASTGKAYSPVIVNVQPTLQSKTVTENGTVTPDQGYDGLSSVEVNVSGSGSEVIGKTLLSPGAASEYSLVNGRIITGFDASYGFVAPANNNGWLDVDWTGAWEIGVAFKVDNTSGNFALFGNESTTTDFSSVPSIELLDDGLAYGISSQSNSWSTFAWIKQNLSANTWYFVTMSYDPNTMTVTCRITTDFVNYEQVTYTMTTAPYHNSNRKIGFGGLMKDQAHTKTGAYIDMYNCYMKYEGTMVWGAYSGEFVN